MFLNSYICLNLDFCLNGLGVGGLFVIFSR